MTVFKSKRDGKLYVKSWVTPLKWLGQWFEVAEFNPLNKKHGPWKKLPAYKEKDFEPRYIV